jgi:hypothetical protein
VLLVLLVDPLLDDALLAVLAAVLLVEVLLDADELALVDPLLLALEALEAAPPSPELLLVAPELVLAPELLEDALAPPAPLLPELADVPPAPLELEPLDVLVPSPPVPPALLDVLEALDARPLLDVEPEEVAPEVLDGAPPPDVELLLAPPAPLFACWPLLPHDSVAAPITAVMAASRINARVKRAKVMRSSSARESCGERTHAKLPAKLSSTRSRAIGLDHGPRRNAAAADATRLGSRERG